MINSIQEGIDSTLKTRRIVSDEESATWDWNNEIVPRLKSSGVPLRFRRRDIELSSAQNKTLKHCLTVLSGCGAIIALVGPRGVGKTTIASQIILLHAQDERKTPLGRKPPYRKLADVVTLFKPLYGDYGSKNTEKLIERRERYGRIPFMVIDELNECPEQKTRNSVLTDIIDRRYAAKTDTLLISNQTVEDFRETIGESIISRLQEHGCIIECSWESFRTPK